MRQSPKQMKRNLEDLDKAISDLAQGNDLSWARIGITSEIQRVAVKADNFRGFDLDWARKNKLTRVRRSAAHCDFDAKRDLLWAKDDKACGVRFWYEKTLLLEGLVTGGSPVGH